MKLRISPTGVRLRLGPREVGALVRTGRVAEATAVGPGQTLRYALRTDPAATALSATFDAVAGLTVTLPAASAADWAGSADRVSIAADQPAGDGRSLRVLVEKDFQCLDGTDPADADVYLNPDPSC